MVETMTNTDDTPHASFRRYLADQCGYLDVRVLDEHRYAAIMPFMFTHAIIVGRLGNLNTYDDRWCYHGYQVAKAALDTWDGRGEPENWHRHSATGRRKTDEGAEYINL